jgi:hypothetical protein
MAFDGTFRKLREQDEAIRRAIDPHGDAMRRDLILGAQKRLGTVADPSVSLVAKNLSNAALSPGYVRMLTDLSASARLYADTLRGVGEQARLLAGPLDDARRTAAAIGGTSARLADAFSTLKMFEDRFRLHELGEPARLAVEMLKSTSGIADTLHLSGTSARFHAAISTMHSPWLQSDALALSARSFATIQTIGEGFRSRAPFDDNLTSVLRDTLGDWRDVSSFPDSLIGDPAARSDFYVARGFDHEITDFPAEAFDEMTAAAGIVPPDEDIDDQDDLRSVRAFKRLLVFERKLRAFIDRVMGEQFGAEWQKHQLPNNMLEAWIAKKETAIKNGEPEAPLIHYADFTDYERIVCKTDNWKSAFQPLFGGRIESVRESLFRLAPPRITTMHARLITLDDEWFMWVELKRLLRIIDAE